MAGAAAFCFEICLVKPPVVTDAFDIAAVVPEAKVIYDYCSTFIGFDNFLSSYFVGSGLLEGI